MSYEEKQKNELEVIEAIYPNELEIINSNFPSQFIVSLTSDQTQNEDNPIECSQVKIKFAFVPNYPDEVPGIEITESDNLDQIDEDELVELLNSTAKDSVGEEMIYTLILSAIEWLNKISDRRAKDKKEYEERKKQEEEELEMKKFEGTRVTVESFLVWKSKFETEMVKLNSKLYHEKNDKKLTGRELFERDKSLIESDLKFLQDETDLPDEDVDIKVDESLFESLDGLELDDE